MDAININILIVDDDKKYALELKRSLSNIGRADIANSIKEFYSIFSPYKYDLILLDLRLETQKEGLDLLQNIKNEDPLAVVIIISAYGDIPTAVEAITKGAKTFLEKIAVSQREICSKVEDVLKVSAQERRIKQLEALQEPEEFIGENFIILKIKEQLDEIAKKNPPVITIKGEIGTGKKLVAKTIHKMSARKKMPVIIYTPGNKSHNKVASDIFGHEKGAFEGATDRHYGCFEKSHRGVFLLSEICTTSVEVQAIINQALINKNFCRIGGNEKISVDVQTIISTKNSLEELKAVEKFREDLYYTLSAFPQVHMPPLRERGDDIKLLSNFFLDNLIKEGNVPPMSFTEHAFKAMMNYNWPLNITELKFIIERAALTCAKDGSHTITNAYLFLPDNNEKERIPGNIHRILAETELEKIEKTLIKTRNERGKVRKCEASKLLYNNRHSMTKMIKKRMEDFPDLAKKFPIIAENYF